MYTILYKIVINIIQSLNLYLDQPRILRPQIIISEYKNIRW